MDNKDLGRIADALEKIVTLMEAEDARRRRRTINEMKETRESDRLAIKEKRQQKVSKKILGKKSK